MRSSLLKVLTVAAAALALTTGAVLAFASGDDDGTRTGMSTQQQEATPAPEGEAQAWLGVSVRSSDEGGVRIKRAFEDGPAAQAGLQRGDRITALDGTAVDSPEALGDAIDSHAPGDQVTVTVVREATEDGSTEDVTVTLGEKPDFEDVQAQIEEKYAEYFDRFLGGSFRYLDEEGATVEVEAVPGTVVSVSDTDIAIDVNGDEGERSFSIGEEARVPDDLEQGERVVVILENDAVKAIHSGHFPFKHFGPGGFGGGFNGGWPKICAAEDGSFPRLDRFCEEKEEDEETPAATPEA
jgi:membrane-associated protease RseP (regulator of RpoE activity)